MAAAAVGFFIVSLTTRRYRALIQAVIIAAVAAATVFLVAISRVLALIVAVGGAALWLVNRSQDKDKEA